MLHQRLKGGTTEMIVDKEICLVLVLLICSDKVATT